MKKLLLTLLVFPLMSLSLLSVPTIVHAAPDGGLLPGFVGGLSDMFGGHYIEAGTTPTDTFLLDCSRDTLSLFKYIKDCPKDANGVAYSPGVIGIQAKFVAMLYDNQISSHEYVADLLDNIGIPSVSRAYAQGTTGGGTGYNAMKPFLEFWKVFRNLAYSLYIIMFVVVGIMIMLRTKVNAQTIITIQTALPNLLITLLLITFSYAIVGFMIDLMYFLIYFVVYLLSTTGIIDPSKSITRLMSYSAWGVIFEGRNSIISAISQSITGVLGSLGTGGIGAVGGIIRVINGITHVITVGMVSPIYLFVTLSFVIAMLKLMVALVKSYIMIIVQTITAPLQILINAMPGSKAFSTWLKNTASYLIPFPVVACMFLFSGILIGNPADNTIWGRIQTSTGGTPSSADNPFGVDDSAPIYQNRDKMWLPPFTLTDSLVNSANPASADVLTLIGFFILLMTPSAAKMAQEWLQVKESPYAAEAFKGFAGVVTTGVGYPTGMVKQARSLHEQRSIQEYGARAYADEADKLQKGRKGEIGKDMV